MPRRRAHLLLWIGLAGCSGSTKPSGDDGPSDETGSPPTDTTPPPTGTTVPDPTGDPATVDLGGACALPDRFGGFQVEVLDYYSQVLGSVADGVFPIAVLEEVGAAGDCKLLRRNNPFCDPGCDVGYVCAEGNQCLAEPLNQDLGTVTIGGLEADVIMHAVVPGNTYFATQLPHPVFAPDVLVELRTTGSTFGDDVVLHGVGSDPIAISGAARDLLMARDQPLSVGWDPPTSTLGRATVHVDLNVDQHGLTPVSLVCDFADDGAGEIDGTLVSALMDLGVTGFPSARVSRRTMDSVSTAGGGCMELEVSSQAIPNLSVEGYIPCDGPEDCPSGSSCNTTVGLCE